MDGWCMTRGSGSGGWEAGAGGGDGVIVRTKCRVYWTCRAVCRIGWFEYLDARRVEGVVSGLCVSQVRTL